MVRITTKTGDQGMTSLWTGQRVVKTNARIVVVGKVDSLIAYLSVCRFHAKDSDIDIDLGFLQTILSKACAELGSECPDRILINSDHLQWIEQRSVALDKEITYPTDWFYAGEEESSSYLNYARALSRECEIEILKIQKMRERPIAVYFNRLSDYLYLAMLYESQRLIRQNKKEDKKTQQ